MIRIFFDHQCEINKELWEKRFFTLLMKELNKDDEYTILHTYDEQSSLIILKDNKSFDIFCPTGLNKYYLSKLKHDKKLCLFIHNMIYEMFGNNAVDNLINISAFIKNKAEQIILSNKIIVPTTEVQSNYNILYKPYDIIIKNISNKVSVVNYFIDINKEYDNEKQLISNVYILYTNYRTDLIDYHNINRTITILSDWLKENNIVFVIVGTVLNPNTLKLIKELDLINNIIYYNFETEEELYNLYQNALCAIFPESCEGFGYYILESWKNNCLTLINENNISYNLLGSNKTLYFNFDNLIERLNVILNITVDEYEQLKNSQNEQLNKYSIENNIDEYKKIFVKLIENNETT